MQNHQLEYLVALLEEESLAKAAHRCRVSPGALRAEIALLETEYGRELLSGPFGDATLTSAGKRVLEWARAFRQECSTLKADVHRERLQRALLPLSSRRSVSPRRLKLPAPAPDELRLMAQTAMGGPDHGSLCPWRLIEFGNAERPALAALFEAEKLRRDPLAPGADLLRARDHATRAPALLAFVVSPKLRQQVPVREQWLAAGAALGNFLAAAHQLGYGAIVLSGERCYDDALALELGVQPHEFLGGFISIGTISQPAPARRPADPSTVFSRWAQPSGEQVQQRET